jgi:hypothetical protein
MYSEDAVYDDVQELVYQHVASFAPRPVDWIDQGMPCARSLRHSYYPAHSRTAVTCSIFIAFFWISLNFSPTA